MKVIILAGGMGTRLAEYTKTIPKPMVTIGGTPIIHHIINIYFKFGFKDYYIALGYKGHIIYNYFSKKKISEKSYAKSKKFFKRLNFRIKGQNCKIAFVGTGLSTMTGGRVKRFEKLINDDEFMLTYGDGLGNVNIKKLINFHRSHGKIVTVTAVRPPARFGVLDIDKTKVKDFREKSQVDKGWINGGFFIFKREFFKLIKGDKTILEKNPLEIAAKKGEMHAFKHKNFWHCMDTKRDRDVLEKFYKEKKFIWSK